MLLVRFFFCLFMVLDVGWWIWADERVRRLKHARLWRIVLCVIVVLQMTEVVWRVFGPRSSHYASVFWLTPLRASAYMWHLLILPTTFLATMAARLVWWSVVRIGSLMRRPQEAPTPSSGAGLSRRQFLGVAAAAAPPILACGLTPIALWQEGHFRIRNLRLEIDGLPPNLDGLRIAQVSDLHVGQFMQKRMLQKVVEATDQLRADLVLLTGDLIDYAVADLPVALDAIKKLDPGSGLAMCIGNHDMMDNGRLFVARVHAAGITLLNGEDTSFSVRHEKVQILGLPWTPNQTTIVTYMANLLKKWKHDEFPILMAHHPHAFDPAARAKLPLTLAGHTHGGQLMLTDHIGCGPLFYKYWSGVYRKDRSALVVSNGVGNWFPLRVRAPAEIVDITLVRKG